MRIIVLVDNHTHSDLSAQHGLSIYVETQKHRILIDCGQDDTFIKNAELLGIDLKLVDICIITHGHYDHGGGLPYFMEINKTADIYIQEQAKQAFYSGRNDGYHYIGLSENVISSSRITWLSSNFTIDDGIVLIQNTCHLYPEPVLNSSLMVEHQNGLEKDSFDHEQSVIIKDHETVLFGGCAHQGILNILSCAKIIAPDIAYVFSGFHLSSNSRGVLENKETMHQLMECLKKESIEFYTGHCTGEKCCEDLEKACPNVHGFYSGFTLEL